MNKTKQARLGERFHKEIEEIKDARLRNGKSKERISTERISNLIARHNLWQKIKEDVTLAEEDLLNEK